MQTVPVLSKIAVALLSVITTPTVLLLPTLAQAEVLEAYNPRDNDNLVGQLLINQGKTVELKGDQRFERGVDGVVDSTYRDVVAAGRIVYSEGILGNDRLNIGAQNFGVTIPDPITGGNTTFRTYNSNNFKSLDPIVEDTKMPDFVNVGDEQYINTRVATISDGGTLNVNIGREEANLADETNRIFIAAKQTSLFLVDGNNSSETSTINWNSNNRVQFFGASGNPNAPRDFYVDHLINYQGKFSVVTLDGKTNEFDVNNEGDLKEYNDWLIVQLQTGNMESKDYKNNFDKAAIITNQNIKYLTSVNDPNDDIVQPVGDRIVIKADGKNARVNIAEGKTLEAVNASHGAIRASNGAEVVIDGKLASLGYQYFDGSALNLTDNSSGINNGVINGNFLNSSNGSGVGPVGYGSNGVQVNSGSKFENNGIINQATTGGETAAINLGADSSANNSGIINVGINGSSARGTTAGVKVGTDTSSFINNQSGTIYIGRGPQNSKDENAADTAMNQDGLTSGIQVDNGGSAINNGNITIGSKVQNAAAMSAKDGDNTTLINNGHIVINGKAATVPHENIGLLAVNAGSGGKVQHTKDGVIDLNGVNAIGIKVLAEAGKQAAVGSAGVINVAGGADPSSGTRNYGVWVEGQGNGQALASLDGAINLSGEGAIGVHARGNSLVEVSANAVPTFTSGSDQIAFFAYGKDAKIKVTGNNAFDVTTKNSTLFRMENGAVFDGTDLSLTTSGINSVGVLGTGGSGTLVNTENGKFIISGEGATGVIIDGGAKGIIDAATQLTLSGKNAVGAIVDGYKHNLRNAQTGNPVASTLLTSAAALTASAEGLTGFIARNMAKLVNSGDISFTGANTTGIEILSGATGDNSGNISINNGSTGILVDSGDGGKVTTANNNGKIQVNGGSLQARSRGIVAHGDKAIANMAEGSTLELNGVGAIGAEALQGAKINISASARPVFSNTDQIAYRAVGAGSQINSDASEIDANTQRATLYRIEDGANLALGAGATLSTSGESSQGIFATGDKTTIAGNGAKINVSGQNALGVVIEGGASGNLDQQTTLALTGENSIGARVDGQRHNLDGSLAATGAQSVLESTASITGQGANSIAYDVANQGSLNHQGQVNLTGANSTGVRLRSGGKLTNSGSITLANGTGIDASGEGVSIARVGQVTVKDGIAGLRLAEGATVMLQGDDSQIVTNGSAHALLLDNGAAGLYASNATLTANGSGNGLENRAEISNVLLNNLTVNVADSSGIRTATAFDPASILLVNVTGSGTGFNFSKEDLSSASADLLLGRGYDFNVSGAGGVGINANTTGTVISAAQVNITHSAGGAALVSSTAQSIVNMGNLVSASLVAPVVDLTRDIKSLFQNQGNIQAASAEHTALQGGSGDDVIYLTAGTIVGDVNTGTGNDLLYWSGGTLDGSLTMGAGESNSALIQNVSLDKTRHITSSAEGSNNQLILSDIVARGGSFVSDNTDLGVNLGNGWSSIGLVDGTQWTLSHNLTLGHSNLDIDNSSVLFAGDGVNATLSGGQPNSLVVNNAGLIDLTNGQGTPDNRLTIEGNLVSSHGAIRLQTLLNEGGALTNQYTDRVAITGNANSGQTLLDVRINELSTGQLTDLNYNSRMDANEGISLVQVAGEANADSFALSRGYLTDGAWRYDLHSFKPGDSDASQRLVEGSGNNYWDYRLGNSYVCQGESSCDPSVDHGRPMVTPQVPSYLSNVIGLAYYNTAVMSDLHKRLGELRHEQTLEEGKAAEMFIRYTGARMNYNSNQGFDDFGYDFKLNYNAFQIGGNLLRLDDEKNSVRGGVAYTRGQSNIQPKAADGYSRSSIDTNSFALYLTWQRQNGFYMDGALSFDKHDGSTDIAREKDVAKFKAKGWSASLETGYPFVFDNGFKLEPQGQIMYTKIKMKDFVDQDDTKVTQGGYGQTIGRLGVRAERTWADDAQRQYTPYARANYIKGFGSAGKTTISSNIDNRSDTFTGGKFGQMVEVGVGGTTTFKNDLSLYAEVDYRKELNGNGAKGWGYSGGVRWTF